MGRVADDVHRIDETVRAAAEVQKCPISVHDIGQKKQKVSEHDRFATTDIEHANLACIRKRKQCPGNVIYIDQVPYLLTGRKRNIRPGQQRSDHRGHQPTRGLPGTHDAEEPGPSEWNAELRERFVEADLVFGVRRISPK
jgi:hypothetical protein